MWCKKVIVDSDYMTFPYTIGVDRCITFYKSLNVLVCWMKKFVIINKSGIKINVDANV